MQNTLSKKSELKSVNLVKFISCIAVVAVHAEPFISFSDDWHYLFMNIFTRFSVPFFFIATGFIFFKGLIFENGKIKKCTENRNKLIAYLKNTARAYVIWSIVYLLWLSSLWLLSNSMSVDNYLQFLFDFFFKGSYYHLWFMLILIYVTPTIYLILRHIHMKFLLLISIMAYIFTLFAETYYGVFNRYFGISIPALENVNHVFLGCFSVGISYITLGIFMYFHKSKLSKNTNLLLTIISFVAIIFEVCFNYYYLNNLKGAYVISTYFFSYFFFNYLVALNLKGSQTTYRNMRIFSSLIYFCHPLIIDIVRYIPLNLNSLVIFILSLILCFCFCGVNYTYKKYRQQITLTLYNFIRENNLAKNTYSHLNSQKPVIYLNSYFKKKAGL